MKTKLQKKQEIEKGSELLKDAQSMVFVDFSKTPVVKVSELKNQIRAIGGTYRVIKKRLLKRVFGDAGVEVDPKQFPGQLATVFAPTDISEVTGMVYRFAKEAGKNKQAFALLGGYDAEGKIFFSGDDIKRIGQLPSREILLAQLLGMLQAPMRQLAYTLDQIAQKK
jgi:large subunit ribosomal protein L10